MSLIEFIGFSSGAWDVYLCAREHIWNWPVGLVNSVAFLILFLQTGLYGSAGMQIFYIGLGFYGWYQWLYGGHNKTERKITSLTGKQLGYSLVFGVVGTCFLTGFFEHTNDPAPFLDAITTVMSLIATWMLAWKITENWYIWIAADVIFIALYFQQGLNLVGGLYIIFLITCLYGVYDWKRKYRFSNLKQVVLL